MVRGSCRVAERAKDITAGSAAGPTGVRGISARSRRRVAATWDVTVREISQIAEQLEKAATEVSRLKDLVLHILEQVKKRERKSN